MSHWRAWALLLAALVAGGVVVGLVSGSPDRPLDPNSTAPDGSRALTRVLAGYGVSAGRTGSALLLTDPDAYSAAQLRGFVDSHARVVLVRPGLRSLQAIGSRAEPDSERTPSGDPGCSESGALAAGALDVPGDAIAYDGLSPSCYGGLIGTAGRVVVLGSAQLLQNDRLGHDGVAALAVNVLTADRTLRSLEWRLPGADAAGPGSATIWDLFPTGVYRAFVWVLVLGALLVLWRARRLGGVVREPLPVVVRAAEVVEGHARLYERAGARDRAAFALRTAAVTRLRGRLALPRGASAQEVAARIGTREAAVLAPSVPVDDAGLVRLAEDLDRLEEGVRGGT